MLCVHFIIISDNSYYVRSQYMRDFECHKTKFCEFSISRLKIDSQFLKKNKLFLDVFNRTSSINFDWKFQSVECIVDRIVKWLKLILFEIVRASMIELLDEVRIAISRWFWIFASYNKFLYVKKTSYQSHLSARIKNSVITSKNFEKIFIFSIEFESFTFFESFSESYLFY